MIYALRMQNKYESGSQLVTAWTHKPKKSEIKAALVNCSACSSHEDIATRLSKGEYCLEFDIIEFGQGVPVNQL